MAGAKHHSVSVSTEFYNRVKAHADAADRSVAGQLEHAFTLMEAVEQVLPPANVAQVKHGGYPARDLLIGLSKVLENPSGSSALQVQVLGRPNRIHADPDNPGKYIQNGVRGSLLENGDFVPDEKP